MAKIIVARNPTVNAWREAPVSPGEAAPKPRSDEIASQPNATRTNRGIKRIDSCQLSWPFR
jgi:hypothetical protein